MCHQWHFITGFVRGFRTPSLVDLIRVNHTSIYRHIYFDSLMCDSKMLCFSNVTQHKHPKILSIFIQFLNFHLRFHQVTKTLCLGLKEHLLSLHYLLLVNPYQRLFKCASGLDNGNGSISHFSTRKPWHLLTKQSVMILVEVYKVFLFKKNFQENRCQVQ